MDEMLGVGSFGQVVRRGQRAVKACDVGTTADDLACWSACVREIHCGGFRHPNICRRYNIRAKQSIVYISMELGDPFDVTTADPFRVLVSIGSALQFLHAHGIMHRDVKPSNIICVRSVYKLIDFGLSRPPSKDKDMITGYMISRWWRPPELLLGTPIVYNGKCDMWSLGVVYYQTLHQRIPFHGTVDEMMHAINLFEPVGVLQHLLVPMSERFTSDELMLWAKRVPVKHVPPPPARKSKRYTVPAISDELANVMWQYKFKTKKGMRMALLLALFVCGFDGDAEVAVSQLCDKYSMTEHDVIHKLIKLKRIW